jgi:hypothetical protein
LQSLICVAERVIALVRNEPSWDSVTRNVVARPRKVGWQPAVSGFRRLPGA